MNAPAAEPVTIPVDESLAVSGLLINPPQAHACYVLAHGAGAGMDHASMSSVRRTGRTRLSRRLRYQFPYMERGSKRHRSAAARVTPRFGLLSPWRSS